MSRGIIVNGAIASGKTTLGKELAKRLNFRHFDLDDYYYPQDVDYRFAELQPRDVIIKNLTSDLSNTTNFVMSGTIGSILWDVVNPLFDLAALLFAPVDVRLERAKKRAFEWFGERVLMGGDLYEKHQRHYDEVVHYETDKYYSVCLERHEKWASELLCPVLRLDGTKPISENVLLIEEQYLSLISNE